MFNHGSQNSWNSNYRSSDMTKPALAQCWIVSLQPLPHGTSHFTTKSLLLWDMRLSLYNFSWAFVYSYIQSHIFIQNTWEKFFCSDLLITSSSFQTTNLISPTLSWKLRNMEAKETIPKGILKMEGEEMWREEGDEEGIEQEVGRECKTHKRQRNGRARADVVTASFFHQKPVPEHQEAKRTELLLGFSPSASLKGEGQGSKRPYKQSVAPRGFSQWEEFPSALWSPETCEHRWFQSFLRQAPKEFGQQHGIESQNGSWEMLTILL